MNAKTVVAHFAIVSSMLFSASAWAAPTVTLSPSQGPAGIVTQVSACGFQLPPNLSPAMGQMFIVLPGVAPTKVPQLAACQGGGVGFGTGTTAPPVPIGIGNATGSIPVKVDLTGPPMPATPTQPTIVSTATAMFRITAPASNQPTTGNPALPPSGTTATPGQPNVGDPSIDNTTSSSRLNTSPPAKIVSLEIHERAVAGTQAVTGAQAQNVPVEGDVFVRLSIPGNPVFRLILRSDATAMAQQGMLDLLQKAFELNWTVVLTSRPQPSNPIVGVQVMR